MATGSTLAVLIDRLLLSLDNFNASDVGITTKGQAGYQAMGAINTALQKLYSKMQTEDVYFMKKPAANTSLSTTANQDHVDISGVTDLGEIENIYEASNDINLEKISFQEYRRLAADPSSSTGNPIKWTRRDGRILIYPRPDAAYTLNIFYIQFLTDLSTTSGTTAIPPRYDYLITDWAKVEWQMMADPSDVARIAAFQAQADRSWAIFWEDISSKHGVFEESDSYWDQNSMPSVPPFDSPVGS